MNDDRVIVKGKILMILMFYFLSQKDQYYFVLMDIKKHRNHLNIYQLYFLAILDNMWLRTNLSAV